MGLLTINSRTKFFACDEIAMTKVSAGKYEVTYDGRTFTVIGGRESGGSSREWFCHHPEFFGEGYWMPTDSMVAAIRLGVQF